MLLDSDVNSIFLVHGKPIFEHSEQEERRNAEKSMIFFPLVTYAMQYVKGQFNRNCSHYKWSCLLFVHAYKQRNILKLFVCIVITTVYNSWQNLSGTIVLIVYIAIDI